MPIRCAFRLSPIPLVAAAFCLGALPAAAQDNGPSLFSRLPANVQATKVVRMVGDSFAPYRIVGDDGKVTGVESDLARALEPLLGVKIEQTIVNGLPAIIAGLDTGRYELSSGPLLSTRTREDRYDILPWLLSKPAYILPASAAGKVKRLEDLCGMRIAFSAGSVSEEYQKMLSQRCTSAGLPGVRDVALQEKDTIVMAMQSGRADAASIQLAAARYLQHLSPDKFHVQTDQTDALGVLNLGFVMKKGSPLAPVLLDAMKRLQASGQYTQILSKWGLETTQQPVMRLNPASSEVAR
ncbi:MAG: transporter substrate-binding domain-containing protein [Variovorax sp.]|nr:transporter substrate-binding domain-containing protein [Variovorax sp.]